MDLMIFLIHKSGTNADGDTWDYKNKHSLTVNLFTIWLKNSSSRCLDMKHFKKVLQTFVTSVYSGVTKV